MTRSRLRRCLRLGVPAFLVLAGLAAYVGMPSLRLPRHADRLRTMPALQQVNAHRYDQEWFDAARAGRIDILSALYDAHYPIDSQTSSGYSALILAAYDDQPAALDYLLHAGANPCLGDSNGNTALMGALYKGELTIASTLLGAHCAIDQSNHAGETALAFASLFGRLSLLPALVAHGADPNHADARGKTPLQIAIEQGNAAAIVALRQVGATR